MQHNDNTTLEDVLDRLENVDAARKALEGLDKARAGYDRWMDLMLDGDGLWCYLRYYPHSGTWTTGCEPSECVPISEWKGKDPLAPVTVLGRSNTGWKPDPESGYEWEFVDKEEAEYAVNAHDHTDWRRTRDYHPDDHDWEEVRFFNVTKQLTDLADNHYDDIDRRVDELQERYLKLLECVHEFVGARLKSTKNLDDLLVLLNITDDCPADRDNDKCACEHVDITGLPTFGGPDIEDTDNIWSWDAERMITIDNSRFRIVPRNHHDYGDDDA